MNYKFVLVDATTGQDTQQWILPLPVVIGRCPSSGIQLDDPSISRRHCQIMLNPHGALSLRDMGSTNGVFVDNARVKKATLQPGAKVRIGLLTLRVELTEEPTTAQSQSNAHDMDETQKVKIIWPSDGVFDIG